MTLSLYLAYRPSGVEMVQYGAAQKQFNSAAVTGEVDVRAAHEGEQDDIEVDAGERMTYYP